MCASRCALFHTLRRTQLEKRLAEHFLSLALFLAFFIEALAAKSFLVFSENASHCGFMIYSKACTQQRFANLHKLFI